MSRRSASSIDAALGWLAARDPGFAALRRAARAALVMPAMFALGSRVLDDPQLATFAAFGSFAMVLLVDFGGSMPDRLRAQSLLALTGAVFVCVGTLVSRSTVLATALMALVAFGVLFSGVASSVLAGATTSLLLAFILPVSLAGPVSSIPDRLAGWGLASGAGLLAIALLWPAPAREPLRAPAIAAARALAARLRSEISVALAGSAGAAALEDHAGARARASAAVGELQRAFLATPYRPTGLSTAARMIVRLVDELNWLNAIILHSEPGQRPPERPDRNACAVRAASATVLEACADLLEEPRTGPEALAAAVGALRESLLEMERADTLMLPAPRLTAAAAESRTGEFISSLDPSFRAQELSFVVSQVAANVELAVQADQRSWVERLLGRRPAGLAGPLAAAQQRTAAHVERHSVWLHNSVRGAVGLGAAVLVARLTGVEHSFWVAFGTLSVLRSSALNTGQNVLRGLLGTLVGFVVGAALVALIGTNTTVLWVLLVPAVLFAGFAPAALSFAIGQAAFTVTLLILFNLLAPAGWHLGLVRVEDVAIGGAVSFAVGLLFWPRGAGAALGVALAEAYADSVRYLAGAVEFGISRCDGRAPLRPSPRAEALRAAAAARRLDDTFRGYLAERGAKPVPLADVTGLLTGVVGLRLAGDAVLDLWEREDSVGGDRAAVRAALIEGSELLVGWYDAFAASLTGQGAVPEPLARDPDVDGALIDAVSRDLRREDGRASVTAARMVWTGDHLDAARRLQATLVEPARIAVAHRALSARHAGRRHHDPAFPHGRRSARRARPGVRGVATVMAAHVEEEHGSHGSPPD